MFTSATETVADIDNADLTAGTAFGHHLPNAQSELKSPGLASYPSLANEPPPFRFALPLSWTPGGALLFLLVAQN
jgi:hypothetical protein